MDPTKALGDKIGYTDAQMAPLFLTLWKEIYAQPHLHWHREP